MQWVFGAPRDGLEAQGRAVRSSQRTHRGTRVFSCQAQDQSLFGVSFCMCCKYTAWGSTWVRSPTAAVSRQFIDSCIGPTCWLRDSDSGVPGTCQRHHTCPQDPASFSTLGQQPRHERRGSRDKPWRLRGHGRKKIRQIRSHFNENFN